MNLRKVFIGALAVTVLSMQSVPATGGGLGKAAARGATKSASKTLNKGLAQKLRRDLVRDRKTRVRLLHRDRHVFRFTSKKRAQQELRKGLRPATHMTSRAAPGRPPSSLQARSTYGLPRKPEVRERIHLKRGEPVRFNRALGGKPGKGEFTSPKRIPPQAIEEVVPLR